MTGARGGGRRGVLGQGEGPAGSQALDEVGGEAGAVGLEPSDVEVADAGPLGAVAEGALGYVPQRVAALDDVQRCGFGCAGCGRLGQLGGCGLGLGRVGGGGDGGGGVQDGQVDGERRPGGS